MATTLKYPVGMQHFPDLIEGGYTYVDKTKYIAELLKNGKYFFLSRPRRFGKSLFLSTLDAYFKGRKELFKGLYIEKADVDWEPHEVLRLDLNVQDYSYEDSLNAIIEWHLKNWEEQYGISQPAPKLENRFSDVIIQACRQSGRQVVILIDEYDKPLVNTIIHDKKLHDKYRKQLQAFYGVLKSLDEYIRFGMLTGVSRFSKVSIFSGLNNLKDISLFDDYNSICGISESELDKYFHQSMEEMADYQKISFEQLHKDLKNNYDGYHFAPYGEDIYNPFSLLTTFDRRMIGAYWYATGTTSNLIEILENATFSIPELEGFRCDESFLNGSDVYLKEPVPLFFQTGYLTIKGYDPRFKLYTLGFPNKEVLEGFTNFLMNSYMRNGRSSGMLITEFVLDVEAGRIDDFMNKLKSFMAGIPYDHAMARKTKYLDEETIKGDMEIHYQNVMFVVMKLMGFYTHTEYRTSDGRIDMLVETPDYLYIMEFNIDSTPEKAMKQIEDKEYSLPFQTSGKKVFAIGANISTAKRRLENWIIKEVV